MSVTFGASTFSRTPVKMGFLDDIEIEEDGIDQQVQQAHDRWDKDYETLRGSSADNSSTPVVATSLDLLASTASSRQTSPSGTTDSLSHGSSLRNSPGHTPAPSVSSDLYAIPWTSGQKRRFASLAETLCDEYDVPAEKRPCLVERSQLSTHELLINVLVVQHAPAASPDVAMSNGRTFLKSSDFKNNMVPRIYGLLLDPKLSSYKKGLQQRILHNIRLHPSDYGIPANVGPPFLAHKEFTGKISKLVSGARSELKRKLSVASSKETIYDIVKRLIGQLQGRTVVRPGIWSRWAWVHLLLIDYAANVAADTSGRLKTSNFWDFVDSELAKRRAKYSTEPDPVKRANNTARVFDLSLKKHLELRPGGLQPSSKQALSPWQIAITKTVEEMEKYTTEDIPDDDDSDDDDDDDDDDEEPHE